MCTRVLQTKPYSVGLKLFGIVVGVYKHIVRCTYRIIHKYINHMEELTMYAHSLLLLLLYRHLHHVSFTSVTLSLLLLCPEFISAWCSQLVALPIHIVSVQICILTHTLNGNKYIKPGKFIHIYCETYEKCVAKRFKANKSFPQNKELEWQRSSRVIYV